MGSLATHSFIMKYLRELKECKPYQPPRQAAATPTRRSTRWIPPAPGVAKIRVDGAVSRDLNDRTVRAVCRNSEGTFLGASCMKFCGLTDPATLEAVACREALALAADLYLDNVVIASDCQGVVRDIPDGTGGSYATMVKEINETATVF